MRPPGQFLLFTLLFCALSIYGLSRAEEIQQIDAQIEQLEEVKRGYEARALRQEDLASYLQFDTQAWLETRRHLQLAEENRNNAAIAQKKIDVLQERKKKLENSSFAS